MHRIFGRAAPKAAEPPPPDMAAYQAKLQGREESHQASVASIDAQLLKLKQQMAGKPPAAQVQLKQQAMALLKRKQFYTAQSSQAAARRFNVDQMQSGLETMADAKEQAMIMKHMHGQFVASAVELPDAEDLEELGDDIADQMADMEAINEVLNRDFTGMSNNVSEADLDAELAGLGESDWDAVPDAAPAAPVRASEADEMRALAGDTWSAPAMPAVPRGLAGYAAGKVPTAVPVAASAYPPY
jgi:hypothetical protein